MFLVLAGLCVPLFQLDMGFGFWNFMGAWTSMENTGTSECLLFASSRLVWRIACNYIQ
jgi:hypothetical protein